MKDPIIPYCGKRSSDESCVGCSYYEDEYCNYWDVHGSNDCPYCNGTGIDPLSGGQCEECNGTGELD